MLLWYASRMEILRVCLSDTGRLPEILVRCSIEITPRRGNFKTATIVEVVERTAEYVLVRDTGKG